MVIIVHIVISSLSLVLAVYAVLRPSAFALRGLYVFIALTFISGAALMLNQPVHMAKICTQGLLYLGALAALARWSKLRLARLNQLNKPHARHTLV